MLHCEWSESSDQVYSHILLLLRACHFVHHSSSYWLIMLPLYLTLAFAVAMVLGPVVQELISTNPRLNCNLYFFFPFFKSIFGIIFCVLFTASNSHILDKKKFDWIFFKNFQIWNQISHLQPGPGFIQERIKSFSLLFVDLTPKPDYGYKASLCSSLAVISSQAWSQQMNMTFKGRMLEVARKTRRWKLDIAGRNSPGGNWFKYLTKVWKSCTQVKRKKHSYMNCTKVQS